MKISEIWRPDDHDFIVNPFPHYEKLRNLSPVFVSPTKDYVILSYHEVKQVLSDRSCLAGVRKDWMIRAIDFARKKGHDYQVINKVMNALLFQMNPTVHTDLRRMMAEYWPSKDWVMQKAEKYSAQVIDELPDQGNFVDHIARKLPLLVINDLLGSNFDLQDIMKDGVEFLRTLDPYLTARDLASINDAATRLFYVFDKFYKQVDREGGSFSSWVKRNDAMIKGYNVDPISMILFMYLAGQDTTSNLISSILQELLSHRQHLENLESTKKIENFVHEILRLHCPVQLTERVNQNEMLLSGVTIPAGSILSLCIGAANRDPKTFENPSQIDLDRSKHNHITFGYGIHHCLGNQIALIEAEILIKHLLPIIGQYELVNEADWDNRLAIRNINSLMVKKVG